MRAANTGVPVQRAPAGVAPASSAASAAASRTGSSFSGKGGGAVSHAGGSSAGTAGAALAYVVWPGNRTRPQSTPPRGRVKSNAALASQCEGASAGSVESSTEGGDMGGGGERDGVSGSIRRPSPWRRFSKNASRSSAWRRGR